ncbi:MAG: DUF937 domain-containing protein [Chitinophagales bacterium]
MAGILDLLNSPIGQSILQGVSQETNQSQDKTSSVLNMALPVLLSAMKKNASTPQGAESLLNALSDNRHNGDILSNLSGLFQGGVNQNVTSDGAGILKHILGAQENQVASALSQKSGVDAQSVTKILQIAAPILLGYLGQQKRQNNVSSQSGIESLIGGLIGGGQASQQNDLLTTLLDRDGDGNIIDDVAGMLGGLFGKK